MVNRLFVVFVVILFLPCVAIAQKYGPVPHSERIIDNRSFQKRNLAGLQGVQVLVASTPIKTVTKLSAKQIKEAAENQLHNAGLQIYSTAERIRAKGSPYLNIRVIPAPSRQIRIEVSLYEFAHLIRNPAIITLTSVWKEETYLARDRQEDVLKEIQKQVALFCQDFKARDGR